MVHGEVLGGKGSVSRGVRISRGGSLGCKEIPIILMFYDSALDNISFCNQWVTLPLNRHLLQKAHIERCVH